MTVKKITKKRVTKKRATKKAKEEFVKKWNAAGEANKPPEKRFKKRGGSKYSVTINDTGLHDIIREEVKGMGGHHSMNGEASPFDLLDSYRVALFLMYGIPLDAPIDKDFKKQVQKAMKRLQKEEPDLYETWKAKHDRMMDKK